MALGVFLLLERLLDAGYYDPILRRRFVPTATIETLDFFHGGASDLVDFGV